MLTLSLTHPTTTLKCTCLYMWPHTFSLLLHRLYQLQGARSMRPLFPTLKSLCMLIRWHRKGGGTVRLLQTPQVRRGTNVQNTKIVLNLHRWESVKVPRWGGLQCFIYTQWVSQNMGSEKYDFHNILHHFPVAPKTVLWKNQKITVAIYLKAYATNLRNTMNWLWLANVL